ncbi:MAG: hypothetical protein HC807_07980 [Gammaproteobacteria bacterium]|nr:hypothetical protein [Gammaproteobacteria bacterium]
MAHGDLYGELMGARTERQVAVTVERYLRRVADEHPRGFLVNLEKGVGILPFITTASPGAVGRRHRIAPRHCLRTRRDCADPWRGATGAGRSRGNSRGGLTRLKQLRRP